MIHTQLAPGNTTTTPAPAAHVSVSVPVGAGVSVSDLYAAAAAPPYHCHRASDGRLVDAFYLLPGQAHAAEGDYLAAAELSIWHHKDAKCYRATLSATSVRLHGSGFAQRFSLFTTRTTTEVLSTPADRFHPAAFAQFTATVHVLIEFAQFTADMLDRSAARRAAEGDRS